MGSVRTCLLQENTLYGVNKGLSVKKKTRYMGSIRTCLLQEDTLYGVRKDLSLTRIHVIWGESGIVCYCY